MGLVYSQCCNQVIDTNLRYTAKPLLELEEARQEKKTKNDDAKKVEAQAKKEEQNNSINTDTSKKDKLLDITA
ncbi:hypothetical protein JG677_00165 [Campylobacter sp. TTU-622]|uniref:hypothetical protein n=1 Tax=Campylobacter sp. TTU-622 TaxID=2800583 RepID=UPI0019031893|nr:hypothetical protein [Campylobacter sp. TTU-622]MBK1972488.1 hypothetical protein [Campylobacter sp. TTU-622]